MLIGGPRNRPRPHEGGRPGHPVTLRPAVRPAPGSGEPRSVHVEAPEMARHRHEHATPTPQAARGTRDGRNRPVFPHAEVRRSPAEIQLALHRRVLYSHQDAETRLMDSRPLPEAVHGDVADVEAAERFLPVAMSMAALAMVLVHVALFGAPGRPTRGRPPTSSKLLIAAQAPILVYFAIRWLAAKPEAGDAGDGDAGRRRARGAGTRLPAQPLVSSVGHSPIHLARPPTSSCRPIKYT